MSKLTAITIFQNRASEVESTLTALYEHHDLPLELIIINDSSNDETAGIIQSVVEYFQHEETYYFEHEIPIGHGRSLNEALLNVTGDIIWVPEKVDEIDFEKATMLVEHLTKFPYAGACVMTPDVESLGITGDVGPLPKDQAFFWNWKIIPPKERYFNPALDHGFGYELWLRTGRPRLWKTPANLFTGETRRNFLDLSRQERNELRYALLRGGADNRDQARIVEQQIEFIPRMINVLEANTDKHEESAEHIRLIEKATRALKEGNYSVSLDAVEHILREDPLHKKALSLKIQLLERMRRYVEASELKYTLKAAGGLPESAGASNETEDSKTSIVSEDFMTDDDTPAGIEQTDAGSSYPESEMALEQNSEDQTSNTKSSASPEQASEQAEIIVSVIIPVAGTAKTRLERCLNSLYKHESPANTELIIIDNASLDDTNDYLSQLQQDGFFKCRVISMPRNTGFAKAVNHGMDESRGRYICIMHDDLEFAMPLIEPLKKLLDENEVFEAAAPMTDNTLNVDQSSGKADPANSGELIEVEYLDSFFMMFRKGNIRFDEMFGAAYFDDIDFSFQLRENGSKVGVCPGLWMHHEFGLTTSELGIPVRSPRYWENAEYFHKKWSMQISFPEEVESTSDVDKLMLINELINPYYPEPHLRQLFDDLFNSEVRTQILENKWPNDILVGLVQLMMKMGVRDVLRQLEDELQDVALNPDLLYELAYFYYRNNIFSRSRFYIGEYPDDIPPFDFQLLELEMLLADKETEKAVELLTALLEVNPSHPELYRISGELHRLNGDKNEADRFFELARQIDPYRYAEEDQALG